MSAADFCAILLANCDGVPGFTIPAGSATPGGCMATYESLTEAQRMCRSYHVCNAVSVNTLTTKQTHCPHAVGMSICQ